MKPEEESCIIIVCLELLSMTSLLRWYTFWFQRKKRMREREIEMIVWKKLNVACTSLFCAWITGYVLRAAALECKIFLPCCKYLPPRYLSIDPSQLSAHTWAFIRTHTASRGRTSVPSPLGTGEWEAIRFAFPVIDCNRHLW